MRISVCFSAVWNVAKLEEDTKSTCGEISLSLQEEELNQGFLNLPWQAAYTRRQAKRGTGDGKHGGRSNDSTPVMGSFLHLSVLFSVLLTSL